MTSIKPDPGRLQEPQIKPDPESIGASPAAHTDEDIYEDAGDLEFADIKQPPFFLTRVPKFLWESWSKLDDNQEIQIGTVRVEGGINDIKRVSLYLRAAQAVRIVTSFGRTIGFVADGMTVDESYALTRSSTKPRDSKRVQYANHGPRYCQHFHLLRERSPWLQEVFSRQSAAPVQRSKEE